MSSFDIQNGSIELDGLTIHAGTTREEVEGTGRFEFHGGEQLAQARLADGTLEAAGTSWSLSLTFVRNTVRSAVLSPDFPDEEARFELARRLLADAFGELDEFKASDTSIMFDAPWGSISVFRCLHGESRGEDGNLRLRWS